MQRRLGHRHLLLVEQAVGVLDCHCRIVDENADRQREAPQCHRVDRFAEEVEHDERCQHRQRDRNHDHDRRPPRAEEEEDHRGCQTGGDRPFAQHRHDRGRDKY